MSSTISVFLSGDPDALPQDIQITPQKQIEIARGAEDIRQRVIERLRHWQGEWFMDRNSGVPYMEGVFSRPVSLVVVASVLRHAIRQVRGVSGVTLLSLSLDPENRKLVWSADVSWGRGNCGGGE